jgi:hypothetical protein
MPAPITSPVVPLVCGGSTSLTCTGRQCPINVSRGSDGKWTVFPYNLNVANPSVKIVWTLTDGSRFDEDPAKNHGIRPIVNGGGQFSGGMPAPRPRGASYTVQFANVGPASKNIEYHLAFEDSAGNPVVCDPLINNSGLD